MSTCLSIPCGSLLWSARSRLGVSYCVKTLFTQNERKELFPGGFKPVYFALAVYVLLVPVAYLFSMEAPGRKDWPLWSYTAVMHALMSALVGIVCKVVVSIVEEWIPKSR